MSEAAAIIGIGTMLYSAWQQADAQGKQSDATKAQGDYSAGIYESNAKAAEASATDAINRGDTTAQRVGQGAAGTIGAQRGSYAGQGVDVNSGSALDVANDTVKQAGIDSQTIRTNAWREALGLRQQAANDRKSAEFAKTKAGAESMALAAAGRTSLVTGGLNAAAGLADVGYKAYGNSKAPKYNSQTGEKL